MINFLSSLLIFGAGPEAMSGWERLFFLLPLIVCTSLVYGATRHENWPVITVEAVKIGTWLVGLTACVFVVALLLSFFN